MSDICVAYWSGTGNTEAMAQAIGAGITAAGKSADVVPMETISPADLKDQAVWVLGCPAMGAEELEDGTVEPFVSELEGFASGKKVALFYLKGIRISYKPATSLPSDSHSSIASAPGVPWQISPSPPTICAPACSILSAHVRIHSPSPQS